MFQIIIYFILFITYSLIGWLTEVICKLIQVKRFINRGFLIGPYCPIYGIGSIILLIFFNEKYNVFVLFVAGIFICTILEYLTSFLLEKIFHARWWDYSSKKMNLNGRICLNTMIPFGVMGVIMLKYINPIIFCFYNSIDKNIINIIFFLLLIIFITDLLLSTIVLSKICKEKVLKNKDNTEEINTYVKNILLKK